MNTSSRFEYRRMDTSTVAGIAAAEKLQANGWRVIQTGLFSVLMERKRT